MKRFSFFLSIWLILVISLAEAQAYRETDRFTGKTTIYSTKRRITLTRARVLYFFVDATEEGLADRLNKSPGSVQIMGCFAEWGQPSWRYLEYHDLIFLVDGESIKIAKTDHEGDVEGMGGGPKIREWVFFGISWADFLRILDAKVVEYRLGTFEFKLKPIELEEMRSFRDEVLK